MSDANKPNRIEAMAAVETLLRWVGEDPARSGLKDTPKRIVDMWQEFFGGYDESAADILDCHFDGEGYAEPVIMTGIRIDSFCEHHMLPIIGQAHVAYIPDQRVVGISKIARLVEVFSRRLQQQESLTHQIANALQDHLQPKGVAVIVEAEHFCMTMRGVRKPGVQTITTHFTGLYQTDMALRQEFLRQCG